MEKAHSVGTESDSRTSGMPLNKKYKVCVIPLVVGQQMVKLQIRGWKDGDPRYAMAEHSKLSPEKKRKKNCHLSLLGMQTKCILSVAQRKWLERAKMLLCVGCSSLHFTRHNKKICTQEKYRLVCKQKMEGNRENPGNRAHLLYPQTVRDKTVKFFRQLSPLRFLG